VLVDGFSFQPHAGLAATLLTATIILLYLLAVALLSNHMNNQLIQAHLAIRNNNQIFRSLLKFSAIAQQAEDIAQLCEHSLDLFRRLEPDVPFGVVLFERTRPGQLRSTSFRGLSDDDQKRLLDRLMTIQSTGRRNQSLTMPSERGDIVAIPLSGPMESALGHVIMGQALADRLGRLLSLFLDQMATTLQNKLLNERLRRAAETDGMTGVFNRRYLERELERVIHNKSQCPAADFSIILFDLVGLKRINDTLGHEAGDRLIVATATGLYAGARQTDVVARFGGDEFVVLCPACNESNARKLANRLVEHCQLAVKRAEFGDTGEELHFAISVGVAGSDCHDPAKVLAVADERMYQDKQQWYRTHKVTRG
jgi:diguanylate cyclase (GGDEF)-like protein